MANHRKIKSKKRAKKYGLLRNSRKRLAIMIGDGPTRQPYHRAAYSNGRTTEEHNVI